MINTTSSNTPILQPAKVSLGEIFAKTFNGNLTVKNGEILVIRKNKKHH